MHFFIIITANMLMFINARFCGEWCIGVSNILFLIQEFVCERPDGQAEMMPVSQQLLFHLKETLHKNTLMANCDISFLLLLLILFLRFGLPLLYPRITMMSTLIVMCLMYSSTPMPESKLPPPFVRKARKRQRTDLPCKLDLELHWKVQ